MKYKYFIHYRINGTGQDMEGNSVITMEMPISKKEHIKSIEKKIKQKIEPEIWLVLGETVDVRILIDNFIQLPN